MIVYGMKDLTQRSQAHELLALAAEEHWGLSPLPPLRRDAPNGKPFFDQSEGREFNLSHSGPLALCALDSAPVGADIQIIRNWRPGLPRRVCSPEELAWVEDGGDLWVRFTQLWTLKECRVKYSGEGLTRPISGIRVPLPQPGRTSYVLDGLYYQLYQGEGWRGAVCGQVPPPETIRWLKSKNTPLQADQSLL